LADEFELIELIEKVLLLRNCLEHSKGFKQNFIRTKFYNCVIGLYSH
jgi:hypothetical protein